MTVHPNVTYFAESERTSPGASTCSGLATFSEPMPLEHVDEALRQLARRFEVLRRPLVQEHAHDPDSPDSWWTAYRLGPDLGPEVDITLHEKLPPQPARLSPGRPVRFDVEGAGGRAHRVRMVTSHATVDGEAAAVIWRDLDAFLGNQPPATPTVSFSALMAAAHSTWLNGGWQRAEEHWRRAFDSAPEVTLSSQADELTVWPVSRLEEVRLVESHAAIFHELQRELAVTPFVLAVGLLSIALRAVLDSDQVPLVTASGNRAQIESRHAVGQFANLVYLPVGASSSLSETTRAVTLGILDVLEHGHYPLFLLSCQHSGVRERLERSGNVGVRDASLGLPSSGRLLSFVDEDFARNGPARAYGMRFGILADCLVSPSEVRLKLTYRSDQVSAAVMGEIAQGFVDALPQRNQVSHA
jgi:hypothetical protein